MEELFGRHDSVLLKDHAVFHHKYHFPKGINLVQWVAFYRDEVGSQPDFYRTACVLCLLTLYPFTVIARRMSAFGIFAAFQVSINSIDTSPRVFLEHNSQHRWNR